MLISEPLFSQFHLKEVRECHWDSKKSLAGQRKVTNHCQNETTCLYYSSSSVICTVQQCELCVGTEREQPFCASGHNISTTPSYLFSFHIYIKKSVWAFGAILLWCGKFLTVRNRWQMLQLGRNTVTESVLCVLEPKAEISVQHPPIPALRVKWARVCNTQRDAVWAF